MEVVGVWRYPVKSLQGEPLAEAELESDGVVGDRRWGIRDEGTRRILTARRIPGMLGGSATYDGDRPAITLPDGRTVVGPGSSTDSVLSEWLGRPVSLVAAEASGAGRAEFFADATDDTSEAIEFTMPAGRYVDAAPVLLLTTASLRAGAGLHPQGVWDPRRFRANILIDPAGTAGSRMRGSGDCSAPAPPLWHRPSPASAARWSRGPNRVSMPTPTSSAPWRGITAGTSACGPTCARRGPWRSGPR